MWAANALNEQKDRDLIKTLEKARKSTEQFYAASEKFLDRYYKYVKEKGGIKGHDFYSALTNQELATYLKDKILPPKKLLQERYKFSLVFSEKGQTEIYSGTKAQTVINKLQFDKKVINPKVLQGEVAHPGLYTGNVRVVLNYKDIAKILKGEVLVTAMTRPEWVSGIKKSGAIVTDVGGILCHAAIVSREMKKPCIIGTKIATKVLKDGDIVEVDANKGIVKIFKKG